MPGSHATQEALGEPAVNPNPGSHMQCALPDEDHEVPGHGMQDEFDEEPEALLYVSAGHMLHTVLPNTFEYVPAPQSEHEEDEVENFPAGHSMHAADDDAPRTVENLPGGHDVQELTGMPYAFQRAVKPMRATDASDVKVTFTRPVTRIDEFSELKDPECCIILFEEW